MQFLPLPYLIAIIIAAIVIIIILFFVVRRMFSTKPEKTRVNKRVSKTLQQVPDFPIWFLKRIDESIEDDEVLQTLTKIEFNDLPFGFLYHDMFRTKGKTAYVEKKNIKNFEIRSVLYKQMQNQDTRISIYFFLDGNLVGGTILYWLHETNSQKVIEILKDKYQIEPDKNKFTIQDSAKSKIVFRVTDKVISLHYYADLSSIPEEVLQYSNNTSKSKGHRNHQDKDLALYKGL